MSNKSEAKAKKKAERAARKAKLKKEKQGVIAEFKKFILRGNVVDMAVGVAVAGAFTAIVTAFTKGFVTPLLMLISGNKSYTELKWVVRPEKLAEDGTVEVSEVAFLYGMFLQAVLDFIIIAATLFLIMKIVTMVVKRTRKVMEEIKKVTDADGERERLEAEAKAKAEKEAKEAAEKAAAEEAARIASEKEAKQEQMYKDICSQRELLERIAIALEKK